MSEQLEPKPTTDENKTPQTQPRYEPPQIMDLGKMAQALGNGGFCSTGSTASDTCTNGPGAFSSCSQGSNFAPPT